MQDELLVEFKNGEDGFVAGIHFDGVLLWRMRGEI